MTMEPSTQWLGPRPASPAPGSPFGPEPDPRELGAPFEPKKQPLLKRVFGPIVAGIVAFIAKFKAILLILPKLKLLTTSGTMLVSIAAWSLFYGWTFAIGIVLLIFVHEMGHVIQLRREGIKASAPMFIPFMGALISAKSLGENAVAEARVGLAGPILGSLGALALIPVWHATGSGFWRALAFFGFFINLFNLIPMSPFDGGRAMAAMAPWMWMVGFVVMGAFAIAFPNPFIIVFLVIGGLDSWRRLKERRKGGPEQKAYYKVTPRQRLAVGAVYVGLIALLVLGMHATFVNRGL
jgi:Zn-dependent protease